MLKLVLYKEKKMGKHSKLIVTVLAVVAIVFLGAGVYWFMDRESNDKNTAQNTQTEEKTSVVDVVAVDPNLATLLTAVNAASLTETLKGDGPFTLFAPTNKAFALLPESTVNSLLQPENVEKLKTILTYHVVAGSVKSGDLKDGQVVDTIQGGKLKVKITGDQKYIVDAAGKEAIIEFADLETSNGIVHTIGAVLLPN